MAAYLSGEGLDVNRESTSMWAFTPSACNWSPGRSVKMPTTWGRMSRPTPAANGVPSARATPDSSVLVSADVEESVSVSHPAIPRPRGGEQWVVAEGDLEVAVEDPDHQALARGLGPLDSVGMVDSSAPSVPSPRPLIAAQGMVASKLSGA